MNQSEQLNIGRAGEYIVLADLLMRGIQSFDTAQGVGYDVVADCGKRLLRLQVKTTQKMRKNTQRANPIYFFHIKRAGKNGAKFYSKSDFDGFALVALDRKEVFYLAFDDKVKSNSICIRDKSINYSGHRGGGVKNGLYFQDLTWERLMQEICEH
jgi:hypothetical protein